MDTLQLAFTSSLSPYAKRSAILVVVSFCCKLFLAFWLGLGNDETYYWLYSTHLQWNYFDHPPGVALFIRIFTLNNLLDDHGGFIRLGSLFGSVIASAIIYRTLLLLHSPRAGWFGVALYQASFYASITAGLYILPDSPQMIFWTACLFFAARIGKDDRSWRNWLLFGIMAGLCTMCKVHGVLVWMGMGSWILFHQRRLLARPQLYIAFLCTALIISPILLWNIHYDFATYRFHSNRVEIGGGGILWISFFRAVAGLLLVNNPVNVLITVLALLGWRRVKHPAITGAYIWMGVPLALVLLFISLFRDTVLPHWTGPAFVSLIPVAAIWLAERNASDRPLLLRCALVVFFATLVIAPLLVQYYPGTFGRKDPNQYGRDDISLDMYGWDEAGKKFAAIYRQDTASGRMPAQAKLVTSFWWGSHAEYYFGKPLGMQMIGLGQMNYLHYYLWTNAWRKKDFPIGSSAYCIIPSDDHYSMPSAYFEQVEQAGTIEVDRSGKPAHYFFVYRLKGLKRPVPELE